MNTLSYTQEYFLCAVNDKGKPRALDTSFQPCLLAGGLMELLHHGYITRDEKKRFISGKAWDNRLSYVQPLYETIVQSKKPASIDSLAETYALGLSQKSFDELFSAIGASLAASGYADEVTNQGLLKEKTGFVPKAGAVTRIIEKVRAEFLEDGTVTEETLCLALLLDKGELIRDYFSKVEKQTLKKRLKEMRASEAIDASVKEIFDYIEETMAAMLIIMTAGAH
jgi:hypothetical protein